MSEIDRVLSKAAWRVGVINFLRGWVFALAGLLAAAILLRIAEQVFAFTHTEASLAPATPIPVASDVDREPLTSATMWEWFASIGAAATVAFALVWTIVLRPRKSAVARRVDEGANLRESLSTALHVRGRDDAWSRAAVEAASRDARGVNVAQAVPITAPRFWPVVVAMGLSLAVVWIAVPRLDVLGWFAGAVAEKERKVEVINAVREVKEVQKKIDELTSQIPSLEKEKALEAPPAETPEPRTAEEIRRAAISDLTKLTDRLQELKSGVQAQKLESMQQQLKGLRQSPAGESELTKSLAKGEFTQARQELEKMKDQLASGGMSPEDQAKVAEQMEKLAEQIEKMAQNQEQVQKALERAGINPEAIKDPASAKEAIQNAQNLTAEQKQQMQDMLEAALQSSEAMQQMASAMQQMSEGMKQSQSQNPSEAQQGQQQAQQAAQQLAQQMSEMEQLQQEMEMAEATMNEAQQALSDLGAQCNAGGEGEGMGECQGGLGNSQSPSNNPWSAGTPQSVGQGTGGPGQGQGSRPGEAPADFELVKKKFIGSRGEGPIVSSRLVEGESIRGESKAEFARVAAAAEQNATEAIESNTIPREYHDAIKSYFGRLKGKAGKAAEPAGEKPADAPAAEPARDGDE